MPVNADFEGGFAIEPEGVAANVTAAAATGIAGLSIEDSTGDASQPAVRFHPRGRARPRGPRARSTPAAAASSSPAAPRASSSAVRTSRETIRRLTAYAEAGAECVYAPGIRSQDDIAAVVSAVAPKPVNVLVGSDFTTVSDLAEAGVRRISVGGALARDGVGRLSAGGARDCRTGNVFATWRTATPFAEIDGLMGTK